MFYFRTTPRFVNLEQPPTLSLHRIIIICYETHLGLVISHLARNQVSTTYNVCTTKRKVRPTIKLYFTSVFSKWIWKKKKNILLCVIAFNVSRQRKTNSFLSANGWSDNSFSFSNERRKMIAFLTLSEQMYLHKLRLFLCWFSYWMFLVCFLCIINPMLPPPTFSSFPL